MEAGSSSDSPGAKPGRERESGRERQSERQKQGSKFKLPKIEPFVPSRGHDPRELKSWAKRTGFVSTFSSETSATNNRDDIESDLEKGAPNLETRRNSGWSPKIEIDTVLGRTRPDRGTGLEIEPNSGPGTLRPGNNKGIDRDLGLRGENGKRRRLEDEFALGVENENKKNNQIKEEKMERAGAVRNVNGSDNTNGVEVPVAAPPLEPPERKKDGGDDGRDVGIDIYPGGGGGEEPADGGLHRQSGMRYGLRDNPGFG